MKLLQVFVASQSITMRAQKLNIANKQAAG